MTDERLRKTAYAAIGVPVHMMSQLRERFEAARNTFDDMRDRVTDEAAETFDDWAAEGEKLFSSIERRFTERRDVIEEEITSRTATIADMGRGIAETFTHPIIPIDEIDGVGPSYASKLAKAGVISTAAFAERVRTKEGLDRLAGQTGIGETLLRKWAHEVDLTRVKGIGEETMTLLNSLRIASISDLASAKPRELHTMAVAKQRDAEDGFAVPSEERFSDWITQAGKLT